MLLRTVSILVLSTLSFLATAQMAPPTAKEILVEAYAKAASEKKNVMVIFHASWCGWCTKMDRSIGDSLIKPLFDKSYVIVHLTVYESNNNKALENPGALDFLTLHGGNDKGLPYWIVLNDKGDKLGDSKTIYPGKTEPDNTGCPASAVEVAHFIAVLKQTSALNEKELSAISQRFRKNEQ